MADVVTSNPNLFASLGGILLTGVVTYVIGHFSRRHAARDRAREASDAARATAETALIGTGPTIIANQNERIKGLEQQIGQLWMEVGGSFRREQDCQRDLSALQLDHARLLERVQKLEQRDGSPNVC